MHNEQLHHLAREKALYRYSSALERGDFDIVASVLREAEDDPVLEQMILELSQVYEHEAAEAAHAHDAALVQQLVSEHLPSGVPADLEADVPPLTVGDVVARMQTDAMLRGHVEREVSIVAQQLRQEVTPLPDDLSLRNVAHLLERVGVSASKTVQKLFRTTAIYLSMGRDQGMAQLAATRRQQEQKRKSSASEQEQDT